MPRKIHIHGTVLFVTFSLETGLFLLANPLLKTIIGSALARAQELHPLTICHFLFEATHVHMIVVVENPDDVKGFLERFKTESAHAINRLLGRRNRTVWCDGYDSPVLLTAQDVIREIVYTYTNPAKDNLEDSIRKYPGLSSWEMFTKGRPEQQYPWVHRSDVPCIKGKIISPQMASALARHLSGRAAERHSFRIEPNAWMNCFGIRTKEDQEEVNADIVRRIQQREKRFRNKRKKNRKTVIGRERLLREQLKPNHEPKRKEGRRMWCICADKELRKIFISTMKELIEQAVEVYQRWKKGDYTVPFPLGLYPPSMPKVAEPLSW
jgi:REP element-mobilizing transposase RayT